MAFEYKLIKREDGEYEELEITIQEDSVEAFCEMMDWDEDDFANNTIRYPLVEEEEEEPKKQRRKSTGSTLRKYPDEMADFIRKNIEMKNPELSDAINKKFDVDITPSRLASFMHYNDLKLASFMHYNDLKLASFMHYNDLKRNSIKKKPESKEIKHNSPPERTQSGKIKQTKKKLFSEEIDGFIERHWKQNKDSNLRQLIGEKYNIWYTVDQIKAHRRMIGCVANKPGRKVSNPTKDITNNPEEELNPEEKKLKEEIEEDEDMTDFLDED